jgi:hypothetical protein
MKKILKVLLIVSLFLSPVRAFADEKFGPFSASLEKNINLSEIISTHKKNNRGKNLIEGVKPITIKTKIFGIGNVVIILDRKWLPAGDKFFDTGLGLIKDKTDPVFLRGSVKLRLPEKKNGKKKLTSVPVSATLYDSNEGKSKLKIFFSGSSPSARYIALESDINNGISGKIIRVHNISSYALSGKICAANLGMKYADKLLNIAERSVNAASTYKIIEISTEGDFQWYQTFGNSSNTEITSILNTVEAIYESQLNLTFNLIKQSTLTTNSRYTSADADILLSDFAQYTLANHHLGDADVYHLFSGKDIYSLDNHGTPQYGTIGIAYSVTVGSVVYGVVCLYPEDSFGITSNYLVSLNYITTAHEIGHNFGATHDVAGSIMGTELDPDHPPSQFSTTSKNQINNHVSNYGSCLTAQEATAIPTTAPTAPASSTATAVATQGGGGSPEQTPGVVPSVNLTASLAKDGTVKVKVTLDTLSSSCTTVLHAGDNKLKINTAGIVATLDSDSATQEYSGLISKKTVQFDSKGAATKIYLKVIQDCGGNSVYYSDLKSIQPFKIKTTTKAVSTKAWLKLLKPALIPLT